MCPREIPIPIPPLLWDNNAVGEVGSEHVVNEDGEHCIMVDECIVPAVKALWAAGVVTLSSCCGHAEPEESHPWGVITIQTKPRVAQRGAMVLRRERYEELLAAEAREAALAEENARLRAALEKVEVVFGLYIQIGLQDGAVPPFMRGALMEARAALSPTLPVVAPQEPADHE